MNTINLMVILGAAVLVLLAVFLAARSERGLIEELLFGLVTDAEKQWGSGTGKLKKSVVVDWVHDKLPGWARPFITADWLSGAIDRALGEARWEWDTGGALDGYMHNK